MPVTIIHVHVKPDPGTDFIAACRLHHAAVADRMAKPYQDIPCDGVFRRG